MHYYSGKNTTIPSCENLLFYNIKRTGTITDALRKQLLQYDTTLCTLLTMLPDKTCQYLSSPLVNVFFNRYRFYRFCERIMLWLNKATAPIFLLKRTKETS